MLVKFVKYKRMRKKIQFIVFVALYYMDGQYD